MRLGAACCILGIFLCLCAAPYYYCAFVSSYTVCGLNFFASRLCSRWVTVSACAIMCASVCGSRHGSGCSAPWVTASDHDPPAMTDVAPVNHCHMTVRASCYIIPKTPFTLYQFKFTPNSNTHLKQHIAYTFYVAHCCSTHPHIKEVICFSLNDQLTRRSCVP